MVGSRIESMRGWGVQTMDNYKLKRPAVRPGVSGNADVLVDAANVTIVGYEKASTEDSPGLSSEFSGTLVCRVSPTETEGRVEGVIEVSEKGLIFSVYPGSAYCIECSHEWLPDAENHHGLRCDSCTGVAREVDEHHKAVLTAERGDV